MKIHAGRMVYSPSDLVRFLKSPFASWMDRYNFENPDKIAPDEESEDERLIAQTGDQHENTILEEFKVIEPSLVVVDKDDPVIAQQNTLEAISSKAPIIYQAALESEPFAGFADFLKLNKAGKYVVWDTKLARAPKPYYAIQLCCYSEMLAAATNESMPEIFGIILGSKDDVEFRVEDFIHFYRRIKASFLELHKSFSGDIADRPEPLPRADHGRWASHAEKFFTDNDHLVRVAGISVGQIKKLKKIGISTMTDLATTKLKSVPVVDPNFWTTIEVRRSCLGGHRWSRVWHRFKGVNHGPQEEDGAERRVQGEGGSGGGAGAEDGSATGNALRRASDADPGLEETTAARLSELVSDG